MIYLVDMQLDPKVTSQQLFFHGTSIIVNGEKLLLRNSDDNSNDAGFGWLWAYDPNTSNYKYKVSIFDGRVIYPDISVPFVGVTNQQAYDILQNQLIKEYGNELNWKSLWYLFKVLLVNTYNGLRAKF